MAAGPVRDDGALAEAFGRWCTQADGELRGARVTGVRRPSSGWTNETVVVELAHAPVGAVVVRMPALVPSFPDHDVGLEAAVLRALAHSDVPVPAVFAVEDDDAWLGAPFVVVEHVDGHVVGDVPAFDGWLTACAPDEQRALHETFVRMLSTVHTFDWRPSRLGPVLRAGVADELAYWSYYVEWAAAGAPTRGLVDALEWCRVTVPSEQPDGALLWGDARVGNVIWRTAGAGALIDWEGATIGPPEMDLGWYLALDALTTHFAGRTVPGFLDRAGVLARYEQALGRPAVHVDWHEVFALVRSVAINECQARLAARTGRRYPGVAGDENPVLAYVWSRIEAMEGKGFRPAAPR